LPIRPRGFSPLLDNGLLSLGSGVIVGELQTDLSSVLALAVQAVPVVALAAAGTDDGIEVDPCLSDQFRLLVVVENRDLEAVVVGRIVYCEP
jgi:hypothetical protein